MGKVRAHISTPLDGFVAGPNQSMENPLGAGGEQLHDWLLELKSWREQAGMDGGVENVSDDVFHEAASSVGAEIMGRGSSGLPAGGLAARIRGGAGGETIPRSASPSSSSLTTSASR